LIREIARGGMGIVFHARQVSLNRPVAVKMILAGQLANVVEIKRFYTSRGHK
jgi:serine/threonine protein kinase